MLFYSSWMLCLLILISMSPSIDSTYQYAGCFTQVYYGTLYTSSLMEPSLCFRLCDTPLIYLQKTVCRCSGGGLTHHNRQPDKSCNIQCAKLNNRPLQPTNTCGGLTTYSVYAEDLFYTRHGHLFNYQILFSSCELWTDLEVYTTMPATFNLTKSSLNKMEKCAAACLDQSSITKSIAFNNDDDEKCLCIMPWNSLTNYRRQTYLTILDSTSCNRYCHISSNDSKVNDQFKCGALNDSRVYAIYDLNGTCPSGYTYVKAWKRCFHTYKHYWNSCTLPGTSFIFDETMSWTTFLQMIGQLQLTNTTVAVDFDTDVDIQPSWKCPSTTTSTTSSYYSSSYSFSSTARYILDDGCLRESSYIGFTHRYANRLCISKPLEKYNSTDDDDDDLYTYMRSIEPLIKLCPPNWYDVNGRCYRMSDERKAIEDAKDSCITISKPGALTTTRSTQTLFHHDYADIYDDEEEQLDNSPKGEVVLFASEWQTRLGFFLLDLKADTATTEAAVRPFYLYGESSTTSTVSSRVTQSSVNEFQMVYFAEMNEPNATKQLCMVASRTSTEQEEKSNITTSPENCTKARHVLCGTQTLIARDFEQACFQRPKIMGLPSLISNSLTHELCLAVCQELQQRLAVIHMNKCYCLKDFTSKSINLTADFETYRSQECGNPCSGNPHEKCGNEKIIVAFHILDSRRTYSIVRTPAEPYPDFSFAGCVYIDSFESSTIYQFNFTNVYNNHPRHCLEFCVKFQQKYALMRSDQCFCTNIALNNEDSNVTLLPSQQCPQQCAANYFYTCGNRTNSSIYSVYMIQPRCRHGFEVAENDQQCVFSHFSTKKNSFAQAQSFCRSLGSTIAKVNDILEIQDILPESVLNTRLHLLILQHFRHHIVVDPKFFWIDRTSTIAPNNTFSMRLLQKCPETSEPADRNCIVIDRAQNISYSKLGYDRCINESDRCKTELAIPVCVDQHIENPTVDTSLLINGDSSVNITVDYSCGDDSEYHLVDDYCYKILPHEVSWSDAQMQCKLEHAMVFVPEKSITLQMMKSLFIRRNVYGSSGFAHVGVMYDNTTQTVVQYDTTQEKTLATLPDSNTIYDTCETSFQERSTALRSRFHLSTFELALLRSQRMGCAYIDLLSYKTLTISCDEIPCNRSATVICQKLPTRVISIIKAARFDMRQSKMTSTMVSTSTTSISGETSTIVISVASPTTTAPDDAELVDSPISVGRDYAPIFFVLAIGVALVLLGFISTLYNRHVLQKTTSGARARRSNQNSIYSPLTSANEFDLN